MHSALRPSSLSFAVVVNVESGTADEKSGERILELLREAGARDAKLWSVGGADLEKALEEAHAGTPDALIVLGGDGTISSAAEKSSMEGAALIPLPGGTMNILPRALYGERTWEEALAATLAAPLLRTVSGGRAGKVLFFVAAIFGSPVLWARAREAFRKGSLRETLRAARYAFVRFFSAKIRYEFNEMHKGSAEAVALTCPLVAPTMEDDRKALEAAVVDVSSPGDIVEIVSAAALQGNWRESKNVAIVATKSVTLSSSRAIPYVVDGEPARTGTTLTVEFVPECFRAIVPAV